MGLRAILGFLAAVFPLVATPGASLTLLTQRVGAGDRRQGLLGNVLNPKAASIFLTLVPQFLAPHQPLLPQVFVLATAQALLVAAWLLAWTLVVDKAGALGTPQAKAALRRVTAAVLIGLGLRTGFS